MTRFWGFRINTGVPPKYYNDQLGSPSRPVLRQGWGWDANQDLRKVVEQADTPREQHANVRMYRDVKKATSFLFPACRNGSR